MARGVFVTTTAIAFMLAVNVPGARAQRGHSSGAHPAQAKTHAAAPATQAHGGPKHTAGSTHAAGSSHGESKHVATTGTTGLTPVQQRVATDTKLQSRLQSRLPAGTNLVTAASGFRNLGQFIAAVNVSHNLGITFSQLKADMVDRHMSLGQSIQDLRPSVNAEAEAKRAESEARVVEHEPKTKAHHPAKKHTSRDKDK